MYNSLIWLWVISAILVWKPSETHAAKQKPLRKEAPSAKGKSATAPAPVVSITRVSKVNARTALLPPTPSLPAIEPIEKREHLVYQTRAGETLFDVLNRYNITGTEKQFWVRSIQQNFGRNRLPAGREVNLYFTPPAGLIRRSGPMQLKALEVDLDDSVALTWERGIRGVLFQRREKPYDVEIKTVSGVVHTSLSEDSRKAGVHSALLSQLIDIFTWDVDLEKDVRSGDSFKILYEKRSRKGQENKAALRILAAELINAGQKLTAIYFEKQKGQGNYYNLEGRSLARSFLRFPLEFASITSPFTENRFHPILKANLPHTGVDFAAARGTPVRAVGDGVIAEAGWNGGYGKAIDVKHDSVYLSRYAHLDSFAEGIGPGAVVKKGQVIGFVGTTGRSTGPHLHFELYKDSQYVDPLGVNFPAEEQIEPGLQKIFSNQLKTYLVELASAPNS